MSAWIWYWSAVLALSVVVVVAVDRVGPPGCLAPMVLMIAGFLRDGTIRFELHDRGGRD